MRAVLVAILLVTAAAFLVGPSIAAAAVRRAGTVAWRRLRAAGPVGGPGSRSATSRWPLRIAVLGTGAVVFAFWPTPTVAVALGVAVAVAVGLVLVELGGLSAADPRADPLRTGVAR